MQKTENMLGPLRQYGFPKPPRTKKPNPTTVEPRTPPPIKDCWDGNKCQLDKQCGKNGKCKKTENMSLTRQFGLLQPPRPPPSPTTVEPQVDSVCECNKPGSKT